MILDIKLQNDLYNMVLTRVNAGITINYDSSVDKGRTILPTQVSVFGAEAKEIYTAITSVTNNTKIIIELTTISGTTTVVEGFTNINSDVVFYYEQNVISFSVTLYDKAVNLSYVLNEKILTITQPTKYKTYIISYNANQEVLVGIAVVGLATITLEIIDIINELSNILTVTANPFAYHEILKILPLIIRFGLAIPILYSVYDNIKVASLPNILKVDCYRIQNVIQDTLSTFNYGVVFSEVVLEKIKDLYYVEPIQVNEDDLKRGLVTDISSNKVIPTVTLSDLFDFIKHYAGAKIIVKNKTIYVEDASFTSVSSYSSLNADRINIEQIEPNKLYNNLRVFNYAIDSANSLSLSNKTSEKVFYSNDLYNKYVTNTYSLNELDNGIYTYNSVFSITGIKDKRRTIEKVWDTLTGIYNKLVGTINAIIDAVNSTVGAIVGAVNALIKTINKILKTKIKTIPTPPPLSKINKLDAIKTFLGYLQTENATFTNAILFEGIINPDKDYTIEPTETKRHLIENTDTRNFIYEKIKVKLPIPIKDVFWLNTYWFITFNNGFDTRNYLIDKYSVSLNEGVAIVNADLIYLKDILSETNII